MEIKKAYEDTHPKLSPSFVGFADILGFSSRTEKSIESGENEGNKFLNEIRTALKNAYDRISACSKIQLTSAEHQLWSLKVFTDNIVVGLPASNAEKSKLSDILFVFAEYQLQLAVDGFLIRGGISHGLHYMDNDIAFGDALIEAAAEDKKAGPCEDKNGGAPKISLAESVKKLISSDLEAGTLTPALKDFLLQDNNDNSIFINYLHLALSRFPGAAPSLADIKDHKETIIKGLNENPETNVRSKFEWAASYHNFVIDNYLETHPMPTDTDNCTEQVFFLKELPFCKINHDLPALSFRRL